MSSRRRGNALGLMLLGSQLLNAGPIPPVTLATIVGQVAIFLDLVPQLAGASAVRRWCLHAGRVWWGGEWGRLLISQLLHADDMHLYYNMASMVYKGRRLEHKLGSLHFAGLLGFLTAATGALMVGLAVGLEEAAGLEGLGLMGQCGVGFSGVLFALKVISNHHFPGTSRLMGWIPVSSKWASWAELVLIQVLVPNASFLGHLAGILAGLLYLHTPLRGLVDGLFGDGRQGSWTASPRPSRPRQSSWGGGTWGEARPEGREGEGEEWQRYSAGLSEEEQMRRALYESAQARQRRPPQPSAPPMAHQDPPYPAGGSLYPDPPGWR